MEGGTAGYMVRKETKRDKMSTKAGRRVMGFEEKLRESRDETWQSGVEEK